MTLYENFMACMPVWGMAIVFGIMFIIREVVNAILFPEDK